MRSAVTDSELDKQLEVPRADQPHLHDGLNQLEIQLGRTPSRGTHTARGSGTLILHPSPTGSSDGAVEPSAPGLGLKDK